MGIHDFINYVVYDNPVSQTVKSFVVPSTKLSSIPSQAVTVITETKPLWKLARETGPYVQIAGVMGASAVVLAAYGAHKSYPKDKAEELKLVYEIGSRYHYITSLALLGVPMCKNPKLCASLILIGTTMFSGACYFHAFTGRDTFRVCTPIGGVVLFFGWLTLAF